MDDDCFDVLARLLASPDTRRGILGAALCGVFARRGLARPAAVWADAGKCKKRCGECERCDKGKCRRKNGKKRCEAGKCKPKANGTPCAGGSCQGGACVVAVPPPVCTGQNACVALPTPDTCERSGASCLCVAAAESGDSICALDFDFGLDCSAAACPEGMTCANLSGPLCPDNRRLCVLPCPDPL